MTTFTSRSEPLTFHDLKLWVKKNDTNYELHSEWKGMSKAMSIIISGSGINVGCHLNGTRCLMTDIPLDVTLDIDLM